MAMRKLDKYSLEGILAAEKASAQAAFNDATLSQERSDAMDYYYGRMERDMPASVGRSRAVSTDVADTIEGLMPALMDIFAGSDEVVRFEPVGPEDEQAAQQETDYVNHVFMQQNPGFMILYGFIKDALLQKVGIIKVGWEETEDEGRETYLDQPDESFAMVAQQAMDPNSGIDLVEHTANENGTHDYTIVKTRSKKQGRVYGVPPEEFGIEKNARDIRSANYCYHELVTKTEADLIAEGYDEDQVKALESYGLATNSEQTSRDSVHESAGVGADENPATRLVRLIEHYIKLDYEGTGKPCLYQIITGGEQGDILRKNGKDCIEPFDVMPFACITPVPVTHRFFGRSIADLVMDIQRIKTALVRGKLDNLYLHNNPRVEVAEANAGPNTLDDLLVSRPGGVVRTKTVGGLNWQVVPDITASIYPALEYWDSTREMRTGVTRVGQGIDANALQNQTATAVNQVFTMAQARMKLIARIIAETGVKDMFQLLHGTIRRHGSQAQTVRLRNTWVQVDPRNWKTRDDLTIHVGLGNGGKAEQFAQAMALLNIQKELLLGGKTNLVDDAKLFNSVASVAKIMGHKNPDQYINDPSTVDPNTGQPKYPPAPTPPDPALIKVQADMQIKQAELQQKGQEIAANAQIAQQADERKAQIEAVQAQADIATEQRKLEGEMIMAQQKFELEKELKLLEFGLKQQQHNDEMQMRREQHQHGMQSEAFKVVASADAHDKEMARTQEQHKTVMEEKKTDREAKREDRMEDRKDRQAERAQKKDGAKPDEDLAKKVDALTKLVKAPRKLVRDKDGKPVASIVED